jgi:AcrR family transcriptional regulator
LTHESVKELTVSRTGDPKAKIQLLRAAEEVFAEKGFAGAKIEDITKLAGLSKGAFYLHFDSKDAVLKHLVESFLARCGSFFAPPGEYPDLPEDPDELLDFCLERDTQIYEFLWQNRSVMRILQGCQGQFDYLIEAFRADIHARSREWVEYWKREGLFRAEIDADLAATLLSGAYHEVSIKMLREGRRPPFEDWLAFALETFVRGYGSPELVAAMDRRNRRVNTGIVDVRRGASGKRSLQRGRI